MKRFLLSLVLLFACVSSFGFVPKTVSYFTGDGYQTPSSMHFGSPGELCAYVTSQYKAFNPSRGFTLTKSTYPGSCEITEVYLPSGTFSDTKSATISTAPAACPVNSNEDSVSGQCACRSTFVEDETHTSCIPAPDVCDPLKGLPTPLRDYETFVPGMGSADGKSALGKPREGCSSGCKFIATPVVAATGTKGTTFVMTDGKFNGASCVAGTPDTGLGPLETRCSAQNMCPGTVNGVDVCVKCGTTSTEETTSETPKPAASGPQQGSSAPTAPSSSPVDGTGGSGGGSGGGGGSGPGTTYGTEPTVPGRAGEGASVPGGTSTRTQTTCTGSSCTTTKESSTNVGDGKYKNTTSEQVIPKAQFCKDNPLVPACLDGGGSFSGTCGEPPLCKGDAIDCAIASAAHKSACAVERGPMPDAEKIVNIDKPLSSIARNDGWGPETGSCPAPKIINFSFGAIPMPFDLLCDFANGIRPFVVGLAWITAAFSFFGFARRGE